MTSRNPSKHLEVPNEAEMCGAIRILMNKEVDAVQCVSRGPKTVTEWGYRDTLLSGFTAKPANPKVF